MTAALPRFRRLWASTFDQTATVARLTRVPDGAGGFTETTTTATYPCRVQPAMTAGAERPAGAEVTALGYMDIAFPWDADVRPPDTVTVGTTVYQVQDVTTGRSLNYGITCRCVSLN